VRLRVGADALRERERRRADGLAERRGVGALREAIEQLRARRGLILFVGEADLLPDVVARELAFDGERRDEVDAAVAVIARFDEQRTRVVGDVIAARCARLERVALHLRVVVEHETRVLLVEVRPVVTCAEYGQPVVAHAVGDGLAVVTLQERQHGRVGRIYACVALRVEQLRLDREVLDIRRRRVIRNHRCELGGARGIVIARGFAKLDESLVVGRESGPYGEGNRPHGAGRAARDECRGGQRKTDRAIYSNKAFGHRYFWSAR
jgi:hypothetical protein